MTEEEIYAIALDKYPEDFCWYGSNPPRNIDDNARDRAVFIKGFKEALSINRRELLNGFASKFNDKLDRGDGIAIMDWMIDEFLETI